MLRRRLAKKPFQQEFSFSRAFRHAVIAGNHAEWAMSSSTRNNDNHHDMNYYISINRKVANAMAVIIIIISLPSVGSPESS